MSDDFLDKIRDDDEEMYHSEIKPVSPLKAKIFLWCAITGGIAVGVVFFLFFITLFLYVFLPLALISSAVYAYRRWKFNRDWRKFTKNF